MPIPFLSSIGLNKNEVQDFKVFNLASDPTLTSGGDYGYFWLNTSGTKTLKFWDGASIRSLIDSTTISSSTAGTANDLSGGVAGSLPYQQGVGDTTFLGIGTADQVLTVNSGATAPQWTAQSSLSVGSATNKTGGNLGDILVQSGSGTTSFLNAGTAGQVITSNGASPQYVNQSTLSVGSATTATTATNVAGGANGSILVQSGAGTTGQLAIGASGYILTSNGTTPGWSASIPSTSVSGLAASATTDTTNASNISSGTLGLARLALATGQFYVGDGSNNPAATAKSSIPLSGFGAAGADVAMGGFKITGLADPAAATDAATRGYVDSVAQGLDVKASCLVATTADITLASPGAVTIDGIYSATDFTAGTTRILVKDQSAPAENGIYIWQGPAAAMTRSADADTWDELVGAFTFIERGTANADSGWVCSVNAGGTLGSTAVTWVKFSQAGSYTQGRGMVLDGTAFNFAQNTNYTADTIPYASGATTIGFIGAGTADQVLRVPGAGGTPAFGAIDLTKSAAVTGALPAANGGTGQSSYAVGDILFADTATSLAKLADVATGNALISGGVTTAPSWGKIGLTTHVSGTLPVANGGTGATTFTAGQVLFGNGTSAINTSANLFWDNSNSRLGIGTASPNLTLSVAGDIGSNAWIGRSNIATPTADAAMYRAADNTLAFSTANVERLRIDSSGNVGIGTATPGLRLDVVGFGRFQSTTGSSQVVLSNDGGLLNFAIDSSTGGNFGEAYSKNIYCTGAQPLRFWTNGVDRMRIDSTGNVGIGTPTPSSFTGNLKVVIGTGSGVAGLTLYGGNATFSGLYFADGTTGNETYRGYLEYDHATDSFAVGTAGANKMFLNSGGNLGLGVTPSAGVKLQVPNGELVGWAGTSGYLVSNTYYGSGDFRYVGTGAAARYQQVSGAHAWLTAPSGTAGNAISFTQAMTLDASGNLLVGSTGIISGTAGIQIGTGKQLIFDNGTGQNSSPISNVDSALIYTSGAGGTFGFNGHLVLQPRGSAAGAIIMATGSGAGAMAERLRLNDAGTLLFKTNGTASAPTIANADNPDTGLYWPTDNDTLALAVGGSDAVYIDSSRNVGIGTNPGYKLDIRDNSTGLLARLSSTSTGGCSMQFVSTSTNGRTYRIGSNYVSGAGEFSIYDDTAGLERLRIKSTGQLNFTGLAADPTGAVGDLYYNSATDSLQLYSGAWNTLTRKISAAGVGTGATITVTHNWGTRDVLVQVRNSSHAQVLTDVTYGEDSVTVTFADSNTTLSNYTVTVIG